MGKININDTTLYRGNNEAEDIETNARLVKLVEVGMEEVGIAQYGIPGHTSGLYIENVWHFSIQDFEDYIEWAISIRDKK